MSPEPFNLHNIFLIGYRCSGKSSVGKRLAYRLDWPFIDTDTLLVKEAGLSVKEIVAKHISPNGKTLQEFHQNGLEEKAAIKLYHQIVQADVVSQIAHAFDLGIEFQKAEIAIKQGLKYTQDQPLQF